MADRKVGHIKTRPANAATGGFPCPNCGTQIDLTIEALLVRRSFTCPNASCHTTLSLEAEASNEAMQVLKDFQNKTNN